MHGVALMYADVPMAVVDAAQINFGLAVTSYLLHAEVLGFSLVGRVYLDHKDRFENGCFIRTSDIFEFAVRYSYLLAFTLTGSTYVLIHPCSELSVLPTEGGDASATY